MIVDKSIASYNFGEMQINPKAFFEKTCAKRIIENSIQQYSKVTFYDGAYPGLRNQPNSKCEYAIADMRRAATNSSQNMIFSIEVGS